MKAAQRRWCGSCGRSSYHQTAKPDHRGELHTLARITCRRCEADRKALYARIAADMEAS